MIRSMTARYAMGLCLLMVPCVSLAQTGKTTYFPEDYPAEEPGDVERLYREGCRNFAYGDMEAALRAFDQVISLEPDHEKAYFERARTKEALQDIKGALTDYTIAIHLNPGFTEAYFNRAILHYDHAHYKQAIADLQKLLEIPVAETNVIYFKGVSYGNREAAPTLGGIISMYEKNVEIYQYIGKARTKLKDYVGAVSAFNQAIDIAPRDPDLYVDRGIAYGLNRQPEMAIQDYRKALAIDQDHGLALYNLALESSRSGKEEISMATYDRIINSGQAVPAAYMNRALLYYQGGNYKKALSDYDRAISLDAKNPLAFINRGMVKEKLRQHAGALNDFSMAIRLAPSSGKAYINRGNLYFKTGDYRKSMEDYSMALALGAEQASLYYNRALAYHELDQKENACRDLTRALEMGMHQARKPLTAYCK